MDGFLIINKPKGLTSQTVCSKIKYLLNEKKVGHCGTLDPNATGVLVVALGRATKTLKLIEGDSKAYIARVRFGLTTDTLDICGKVIDETKMDIKLLDIKLALDRLKEEKTQIPPMTSAIKINGKKLYEYQREGKDVLVKERNVRLNNYKIVSDLELVNGYYEISIYVDVTKGYYVRSMARDLGELLNGYAILSDLERVRSGNSKIENSVKLEDLTKDNVISIFDFIKLDIINVKDYLIPLIKNGITLDERQVITDKPFYVNSSIGIIAIYEPVGDNKYKPIILFGGENGNN